MTLYISAMNQRLPTVFLDSQHRRIRPPEAPKKDIRSPDCLSALWILQYEIFIKLLSLINVSRRCSWAPTMGQIVPREPSMRAHLSCRGLWCWARWPDWGRMPLLLIYIYIHTLNYIWKFVFLQCSRTGRPFTLRQPTEFHPNSIKSNARSKEFP